jgi:site-specific DNA-methyltransferase (adenine-specific)
MNTLYYGDNLIVLREHIADESVDLVYLDPPFNSKRVYNVYLKTPKGHSSEAQVTAFEDSWTWGEQAEQEYADLLRQPNTDVAEMIASMRRFLKESDVMAYLVMMANRLLELHRVLKPTGSLYLHCDPTASHYLKIVLDAIFGADKFINEITWKRTSSHNDAKRKFADVTDIIFCYAKGNDFTFNVQYTSYSEEYLEQFYRFTDENGRRYRLSDLRSPNPRPNLTYDYKGYKPHPNGWAVSREKLELLDREGRLHFPAKKDGRIQLKRFLDEMPGMPVSNVWDDIQPVQAQAQERLGYPTQKPLALLERILQASSNEGDVVLDPFCGCGTAVHAAQKLGRQWIGIDITHLAISLIEKRLKDAFTDAVPPLEFQVHGVPQDLDSARDLASRDKYEFQYWACSLVNAQPYQGKKKGADTGIDGVIYFQDDKGAAKKVIVSVKGGENVGVTMVKDLIATVQREEAQIGLFVTLANPTEPMKKEAVSAGYYDSQFGAFPKIQILTIEDLLNEKEGPRYPDMARGGLNFKKAKKEKKDQPKLFEE